MSLNDIPAEKTKDFPGGVSEVVYDTQAEMTAFLDGLNYADDIDVQNGEVFQRDGKYVVRVCVGDWDDDEFDDLDEEDLDDDEL